MEPTWKEHVLSSSIWVRGIFMLMFAIVNYFVKILIGLIATIQFIIVLITGKPNDKLLHLGAALSTYCYQILKFLTFGVEHKPYPFAEWPTGSAPDQE